MRKNLDLYRESDGTYATDLFTSESIKIIQNHNRSDPLFLYIPHLAPHAANTYDPLQAPQEIVNKFTHIKDERRRRYAAMVCNEVNLIEFSFIFRLFRSPGFSPGR